MGRMTYEHGLQLFRKGHLSPLIEVIPECRHPHDVNSNLRVLLGYALALIAETNSARTVVALEPLRFAPSVRSQLESTLGIISWRSGDPDSAWKHLNLGIQAAVESKDSERIAWAHLH